jgi:hypothetical protein
VAKQRDLHQYRFIADKIMDACQLQHVRIMAGGHERGHDIDFYLISVARLRELIRKVCDRLQVPEARPILTAFDERFPHVMDIRDWLMHPAEVDKIGWASNFPDAIYKLGPDRPVMVIDGERDHPAVAEFYERICRVLGDLPT